MERYTIFAPSKERLESLKADYEANGFVVISQGKRSVVLSAHNAIITIEISEQ